MAETIVLEIARYSPEQDAEPRFQTYEVPFHKEWVVLDALNHVKDKIDGTLSYRWSCRMGICGSCGMMVNGEPKLSCATFLSSYAENGNKVRVEPLRQAEESEAVADSERRAAVERGRISADTGAT